MNIFGQLAYIGFFVWRQLSFIVKNDKKLCNWFKLLFKATVFAFFVIGKRRECFVLYVNLNETKTNAIFEIHIYW